MVNANDGGSTGDSGLFSKERLNTERERLEALMAEIRALQTGGHAPAPAPRPRWRPLIVLDVLVVLFVVHALIAGTPLGSLAYRAWAWAIDSPDDVRPLLSYFSQPTRSRVKLAPLQEALQRAKGTRRANKERAADLLPESVAFLFAQGVRRGEHFDVRLPAVGRKTLASVAVIWPGDAATPKQRETALLEGLSRLRQHLGADEAAVAALAVDPDSLAFALERARISGAESPERFEAFGRYLPHDERRAAAPLVHSAFALAGAYAMAWPIAGKARVTSPFGMRNHPVLGQRRLHKGIDIRAPIGTPVRSAQEGEVIFSGFDGVNGHFVRLDHGHGLTTTYCHLDSIKVRRGDSVTRGATIAESGNSGRSTGPHLHFQVELSGTPVDPALFR